jgi:hypothetical protein
MVISADRRWLEVGRQQVKYIDKLHPMLQRVNKSYKRYKIALLARAVTAL